MKTNRLFLLAVALGWLAGCKEPTIDEGILPLREAATVDANGGTWQTVVLKSAADIPVPQPAPVTSDEYQRELTAIKNGVLGSTPDQLTALSYWADGGILRWNQIARQLVAKYNVTPVFNDATGQFMPADANNPSTNAPYAARLYALLSVAQYDALVVAWRAKYQYNRPALERQGVLTRVPVADLPSYPSEDAVIAEASCQILAAFFPNETAWLKTRATEHKQSRLWAGANVASDVKAGEELAAAVAAKVIAYSKTDRFANANDLAGTWQQGRSNAPFEVKWMSLEIPARPPVLPLAGRVRTWFDSTAVVRSLPPAPPAFSSPAFLQGLAEVRTLADARTREQWRIADFWTDGTATYTTPGHWNLITEDLVRQARQNELRAARTYALLNRAMHDAATAAWLTKYTYFLPRPAQVDPLIKVATDIPNMPAYPASHATFSAAAATVLGYLFPDQADALSKQATEAALSRVYGGVNYRFATDAGARCGTSLGGLAVDWAKNDRAN